MDEDHLLAAFRYVALNPVKAGLVAQPQDWPWSSVIAHLAKEDTRHVKVAPVLSRIDNFAEFISHAPENDPRWSNLLKAELIGRPVGAKQWILDLEAKFARSFSPRKRGPKTKDGDGAATPVNPPLFE